MRVCGALLTDCKRPDALRSPACGKRGESMLKRPLKRAPKRPPTKPLPELIFVDWRRRGRSAPGRRGTQPATARRPVSSCRRSRRDADKRRMRELGRKGGKASAKRQEAQEPLDWTEAVQREVDADPSGFAKRRRSALVPGRERRTAGALRCGRPAEAGRPFASPHGRRGRPPAAAGTARGLERGRSTSTSARRRRNAAPSPTSPRASG